MRTSDPLRLEIAHGIPGRLRLRWRGDAALPSGLVTRLESAEGVEEVAYRPSSRSLVLQHGSDFGLPDLHTIADELGIELCEPPPPAARALPAPSPRPGASAREPLVANLEAVLLLALMGLWARDLLVSRTLRIGTLLLLTLTGLHLHEFWQRRRGSRCEDEADLWEITANG
jgi:hypothetical protein